MIQDILEFNAFWLGISRQTEKGHMGRSFRLFAITIFVSFGLTGFSGCGSTNPTITSIPTFALTITPGFLTITDGVTSSAAMITNNAQNGFRGNVVLTVEGLPAGGTSSPAMPFDLSPGSTQQVTFLIPKMPDATTTLILHGTSGSVTKDSYLLLAAKAVVQTFQSGSTISLQTNAAGHVAQLNIDTNYGGVMSDLLVDGIDFIEGPDTGGDVQVALYDGNDRYDNCSSCTGLFGWNPTQGGDAHGHGSPVLD